MRTFIGSLVLFTFLVAFGAFTYYYIDNTAQSMLSKAETVERSVMARDWAEAGQGLKALTSSWHQTNNIWTILLDHQELDNINLTMTRARQFMSTKDVPGAVSELGELKLLIQHIPEKEALNVKNIL